MKDDCICNDVYNSLRFEVATIEYRCQVNLFSPFRLLEISRYLARILIFWREMYKIVPPQEADYVLRHIWFRWNSNITTVTKRSPFTTLTVWIKRPFPERKELNLHFLATRECSVSERIHRQGMLLDVGREAILSLHRLGEFHPYFSGAAGEFFSHSGVYRLHEEYLPYLPEEHEKAIMEASKEREKKYFCRWKAETEMALFEGENKC